MQASNPDRQEKKRLKKNLGVRGKSLKRIHKESTRENIERAKREGLIE